ncbi:hypothetical protein [Flavobacterium sp. GP15]|uniref:hypothetical protein n=1 Tax=Flavobacterium sp. GP15 TaxID=2758567 RepID=UPI00165D333F|nr:hypothetical protein [Flavobacterium sp. GP15]
MKKWADSKNKVEYLKAVGQKLWFVIPHTHWGKSLFVVKIHIFVKQDMQQWA